MAAAQNGAHVIRADHVFKRYGELIAVNDISFAVKAGEIFAFLGPNGAGKTTTIKMLTTLLRPSSGTVEVAGLDPTRNALGVRRSFGIVFQDSSLDPDLNALENLRLHAALYSVPRNAREERTEQLLKLFDLWDRRDTLVKRYSG